MPGLGLGFGIAGSCSREIAEISAGGAMMAGCGADWSSLELDCEESGGGCVDTDEGCPIGCSGTTGESGGGAGKIWSGTGDNCRAAR